MLRIYLALSILHERFIHLLIILSGFGGAGHPDAVRCRSQPLCLCRRDHAGRHCQKERRHDDHAGWLLPIVLVQGTGRQSPPTTEVGRGRSWFACARWFQSPTGR